MTAGLNAEVPASELSRIGQLLLQARMQSGFDAETIARELNLQVRQVHAMEKGDFSGFSSPAFVKGYMRAFAKHYALDGDQLIRLYEAALPEQKSAVQSAPVVVDKLELYTTKDKKAGAIVVILVLAVTVLAVYFFRSFSHPVIPVDMLTVEPGEPVQQAEVAESLDVVVAPVPDALPETASDTAIPAVESLPVLHMVFTDDCWVQLKNNSDEVIHDKTYRKGDVLDLPVATPLHLWLGRASAATISYGGMPVAVPVKPGFQSARFVIGDESTGVFE